MGTMNVMEKALNIRAYYHQVISGNIANAETPNYKEKDIDFQKELGRKIVSAQDIEIKERMDYDGMNGADGNTVDIENQIVKLTENNLMFTSLVRMMSKKFSMMRYVISEGRR